MLFKNTLYQLYGRTSSLIFGLASVPIFLHFLGSEAYGVVGLYLSLVALSGLVDMGVPVSANRQISTLLAQKASVLRISQTVRSLEIFIWTVSALLLIGLTFSADSKIAVFKFRFDQDTKRGQKIVSYLAGGADIYDENGEFTDAADGDVAGASAGLDEGTYDKYLKYVSQAKTIAAAAAR